MPSSRKKASQPRPLKVCFLSHSAQRGGAELYLLEAVTRLARKGVAVRVILPASGFLSQELSRRGIPLAIIPSTPWISPSRPRSRIPLRITEFAPPALDLVRQIRQWDVDLVYTNTITLVDGAVAAFFLGKPHVWHLHEFGREDHGHLFPWPFPQVARFIGRYSSLVLTCSRALEEHYRPHLPAGKLRTIFFHEGRKTFPEPRKRFPIRRPVEVILPFRDDPFLPCCLDSLARWQSPVLHRLLLIDDHGRDRKLHARIKEQLAAGSLPWRWIRNRRRLGYPHAAHKGIALSRHDVVLMNSDTLVTQGWLDKLQETAYQDDRIATVTPLSNNATIFSLPSDPPSVPVHPDTANWILEQLAPDPWLEVPSAHGYCMYLKRAALRRVGNISYRCFPGGYCEENDYSMRLRRKGYLNVASCRTFVYHRGSQVYGRERARLLRKNFPVLLRRHPDYPGLVDEFLARDPLSDLRRLVTFFARHPEVLPARKICLVASLQPGKGQREAVRALALLGPALPVHLLLAGPHHDRQYWSEIVSRLPKYGLSRRVHYLGPLARPDILFRISEFTLVPSACEAFGRVALESMLAGKPVVGSRNGGLKDLIREGDTGLLFRPGEIRDLARRMKFLLERPATCARMGVRARRWAEGFVARIRRRDQLFRLLRNLGTAAGHNPP